MTEEELDKAALELWENKSFDIIPMYPWNLVRILPREQKIGSLWVPDNKSVNKPLHEGIVLRTFKPKMYRWTEYGIEKERLLTSQYEPGDHVIYQHFSGIPAGLDLYEKWYRYVPEYKIGDHSGIIGTLNYEKESIRALMLEWLEHEGLVDNLMAEFDIVRKQKYSKTTSGASVQGHY
jgi:hypothetical protein